MKTLLHCHHPGVGSVIFATTWPAGSHYGIVERNGHVSRCERYVLYLAQLTNVNLLRVCRGLHG